jgi:hypothetical protein
MQVAPRRQPHLQSFSGNLSWCLMIILFLTGAEKRRRGEVAVLFI